MDRTDMGGLLGKDNDLIPVTLNNTALIPFDELYQDYYFPWSTRFSAFREPLDMTSLGNMVVDTSDPSVAVTAVEADGIRITTTGVGTANIMIFNTATGYRTTVMVRVTEVSQAVRDTRTGEPAAFTGMKAATAVPMVASGYSYSIALKANGTVWTWGNSSSAPVQVSGILGAHVAAGYSVGLVATQDGMV